MQRKTLHIPSEVEMIVFFYEELSKYKTKAVVLSVLVDIILRTTLYQVATYKRYQVSLMQIMRTPYILSTNMKNEQYHIDKPNLVSAC